MLHTEILVEWKFATRSPALDTKQSHSANLKPGFAVGLECTLLSIGLLSLEDSCLRWGLYIYVTSKKFLETLFLSGC